MDRTLKTMILFYVTIAIMVVIAGWYLALTGHILIGMCLLTGILCAVFCNYLDLLSR